MGKSETVVEDLGAAIGQLKDRLRKLGQQLGALEGERTEAAARRQQALDRLTELAAADAAREDLAEAEQAVTIASAEVRAIRLRGEALLNDLDGLHEDIGPVSKALTRETDARQRALDTAREHLAEATGWRTSLEHGVIYVLRPRKGDVTRFIATCNVPDKA